MYPDGCSSDFDCGPGYVCDYPSAECLAASPPPGAASGIQRCSTTSDCDLGLVCDRYARCVAPEETGGATSSAGKGGVSRAGGAGRTNGSGGGAGESGAAGQP